VFFSAEEEPAVKVRKILLPNITNPSAIPRERAEMKAAYTIEIACWTASLLFKVSLPGQTDVL
jgi:hypothetical protein